MDSRIQINQGKSRNEPGEQLKSWSLNAVGYQSQILINRDLFVATKVYEGLKNESNQISEEDLDQIQIRRGEVRIPKDLQEKEAIDQSKIEKVKGVSNVRIMNEIK
ncbi:hypothetical protein [Mangrovibacterium sp.]|uniref:hypothetical protein n=1 Tax=Mangrovibacterium sp. TaxID=1961364 RepID=UPI003567106D